MEPILVKMTEAESKRQINFLIKKELHLYYLRIRKPVIYLLWLTLLVAALVVLTPSESLVTLKVMSLFMVALSWLLVLVFAVVIGYKWLQRIRWRDYRVKKVFENDASWWLAFDDDKLVFSTPEYKTEIKWIHYKYYDEDEISVYLFYGGIYEAVSVSILEIGEQNFDLFKKMVQSKLSFLKTITALNTKL